VRIASFTFTSRIDAPIDVVFDVLTDHRGYTRFSPAVRRVNLEQEGNPAPNGVGAIRAFPVIGPPVREQVTEYVAPTRFAYRILSGVPVREHTGVVDLSEQGGGTLMSYRVETTPRLPGYLGSGLTAFLRFAVGQLVAGVRKIAEQRTRSGG
jgi:uncharacterized protein YndB with AHSA1/START domain